MSRASRLLYRLRRDVRGLALLEFAFILPIFLILALVGAELTNYVITRMRVSQIALHLADNAARIGSGSMLQAKTITEMDINDVLTGAGYQSGELRLYDNGRVMISSLEPTASPNTAGRYKIAWKRCRGKQNVPTQYTDKAATFTGGLGDSGRLVTAPDYGATMFVEVYYDYQPLIGARMVAPFISERQMVEVASMMVRDRRDTAGGSNGVYPVSGVTASTCNRFTTT
ncbi:TadE/TadG family type IV pilus assembly protein [Sphingomonas sp.]|uniref:TadE/TadG family type IV pilus assembly protein n=1 Tax=Sphingomonas sp. TaxID=28214 RepID=UPI002DD626E5|nr:pilus assembly protein [Sphingomonas sp.]